MKAILWVLLSPVLLVLAGVAAGVILGFGLAMTLPWISSSARAAAESKEGPRPGFPTPEVPDPYERALHFAGHLSRERWPQFMADLRKAWSQGAFSEILKKAHPKGGMS